MNGKILLKAMKFSLLPTLLTFTLLFLGFMSFEKAFNFLTANDGWSIFVRISLFIAEIILISVMYGIYKEEEEINKLKKINDVPSDTIDEKYVEYSEWLGNSFFSNGEYKSSYSYKSYKTENDDIIIIKRNPKK